jgi:hypothetical protein
MVKSLMMKFSFILAVLISATAFSQENKAARPSPPDSASGKIGAATIKINYSSPSVKGRQIWGQLVPYGEVWRAGANEATTFETDKNIQVEGKSLPAGKYGLFAIPNRDEWTIIFNKVPNQWGAFKYDASKDQLRVTVKPQKSATSHERLSYAVTSNGFTLRWENLEVPVSVKAGE